MENVDTEELWHLLHDEGEQFDLPSLAELAFGHILLQNSWLLP